MSHFYSRIKGSRGPATRCGDKHSGIAATAASWDGAVTVRLHYNAETGKNHYFVEQHQWGYNGGVYEVLAHGIVGEKRPETLLTERMEQALSRQR